MTHLLFIITFREFNKPMLLNKHKLTEYKYCQIFDIYLPCLPKWLMQPRIPTENQIGKKNEQRSQVEKKNPLCIPLDSADLTFAWSRVVIYRWLHFSGVDHPITKNFQHVIFEKSSWDRERVKTSFMHDYTWILQKTMTQPSFIKFSIRIIYIKCFYKACTCGTNGPT